VKLLTLVPESSADPSGISDSPGSFGSSASNGSRGRSNNYLLDGTDMNDGYRNLPAINEAGVFGTPATCYPSTRAEFPSSRARRRVRPQRRGDREHRHQVGANTLAGTVYEYFRDAALGSRNYFNAEPPRRTTSATISSAARWEAPLRKDKSFYFVAYEGSARRWHPGPGARADRRRDQRRDRGPTAASSTP